MRTSYLGLSNEIDISEQADDEINVDINLLKLMIWINAQPEYNEKHYWLINEYWQKIWPNDSEVHSNLQNLKENVIQKFEGDKRFLVFESFGCYGVFFFLIGSIFFILGDYHGTPRQYAMGFLAFACGYLFFLIGKYKTWIEQFVHEGEKPSFFDLNSISTLFGLIACVTGWLTFMNKELIGETWRFQLNLLSNILWVISGVMFFCSDVFVTGHFLNWEFYESSINALATVMMLFNAVGKIQYKKYNVFFVSSIGTCFFLIGGISFIFRQIRNITASGQKDLTTVMKILRHYLKSN